MLKLRPAKERYLGITEADACEVLGITPDQLRIARALDREKVKEIKANIQHLRCGVEERKVLGPAIIAWLNTIEAQLPTFDTEDKPE